MKRLLVAVLALGLMANLASAGIVLQLDFNSTTQDGGPHPQAGWESYDAGHEVPGDFVTRNYGGITVTPTWSNTTDNRVQQMIDRGAGNDANWDNAAGDLDLVTDFIGIDTRTNNGGNGDWDGETGTPTFMEITIGGLLAGDYEWTSYHHDTERVHGEFAVWISTDSGANFLPLAKGLMTNSTTGGTPPADIVYTGPDVTTLPSVYTTSFNADGTNDVVMRFAPYANTGVHQQIWGMNGFVLTPEPATLVMLGLGGIAAIRRRKAR